MAGPTAAHTDLAAAVPSDGQTVATPPAMVELVFTASLQREFAQVVVARSGRDEGERLDLPAPDVAGTTLRQPLPGSLTAGRYVVGYRVVAADGHPIVGQLSFTYAPAAHGPSPSPDAATSTAAPTGPARNDEADGTGDGTSPWAWGWLAGALLLALAVLVIGRSRGAE
jgi:copper resistance protein C